MPVYNAEQYIDAALESILEQTFTDFQLLIVDDASTDMTHSKLLQYTNKDNRIHLITHDVNAGIIECRNQLLNAATAEFIALMDGDDVCVGTRFERQVQHLQVNPLLAAVGCAYTTIGGANQTHNPPVHHKSIVAHLTLRNVMMNSGMMVRRSAIVKHQLLFDSCYRGAADYDFWCRLAQREPIMNDGAVLMMYRVHQEQESTMNKKRQEEAHLAIVKRGLSRFNVDAENDLLRALIWPARHGKGADLVKVGRLVGEVISCLECDNKEELFIVWDISYRGLCRVLGFKGLFIYCRTRGLHNLMKGRCWGLHFLKACLIPYHKAT